MGIGTNLNSRLTLNGVISDNSSGLSLTKSGPGNLVLAGANILSGGTNVNAGIINVQNNSALGSNVGAVSVASGASLELQTGVTISDHQLTTQGAGPTVAETVPLQWFPIGPAPVANEPGSNGLAANNESYSGRIAAIATDPSNPNIFYVAPAGGGVWKTTDGGINWVPLLDNVPGATYQNMFMGALAVSQTNPNLILAGTGEGNFSGDPPASAPGSSSCCGLPRNRQPRWSRRLDRKTGEIKATARVDAAELVRASTENDATELGANAKRETDEQQAATEREADSIRTTTGARPAS